MRGERPYHSEESYQASRVSGAPPNKYFYLVLPHLTGRTLDCACGRGLHLAHMSPSSIGMDISETNARAVRDAGRECVCHNVNEYPWPFADQDFDSIYSSHTLEHVRSPMDFLTECNRILKPGGHLVIAVPHETWLGRVTAYHAYFAHPYHLYAFSRENLKHLCELAGFLPILDFFEPMCRIARRLPMGLARFGTGLPQGLLAPFAPSYDVVCRKVLQAADVEVDKAHEQVRRANGNSP